jgi:maltose O-acetyltransferase
MVQATMGEHVSYQRSRSVLSRVWGAAKQELGPTLSRRLFADVGASLPNSAFAMTRTALYRAAGVRIGEHSLVQGAMWLTGVGNVGELLSIGDNTLITRGLHVDLGARVCIGDHVRIGHDVSLLTVSHAVGAGDFRAGPRHFGEIRVEDGCWIGSRSVILSGVTVGRGSVVAAGAVVTRDVPPDTLVAGVPARVVRDLPLNGEEGREGRSRAYEMAGIQDVPSSRMSTPTVRAATG